MVRSFVCLFVSCTFFLFVMGNLFVLLFVILVLFVLFLLLLWLGVNVTN